MRIFYSIISLLIILTVGCHRQEHDPRLLRVADLAEHSYEEALAALDSIDPTELYTGDRHFYDLLTIKANDKAFVTHTSDSLILDVLSYYEHRQDDPNYLEALYYGGRVYHDMGDCPSALYYYRKALDVIPQDNKHNLLRGKVLCQTSGLLNSLRLYDEALEYIHESLRIDSIERDSVNLFYDLDLYASILFRSEQYDKAEVIYDKAEVYSDAVPKSDRDMLPVYRAAIKYYKGNNDSALILLRQSINDIAPFNYNYAFSCAAKIYRTANIPDSAILFCNRLLRQTESRNKHNAYKLLLSPDLIQYLPQDSIPTYALRLRECVEEDLNHYGEQETLIQNSIYNYQSHVRAKERAQDAMALRDKILIGCGALVIMLVIGILILKNRNKSNIIRLQQALENIMLLKSELKEAKMETSPDMGEHREEPHNSDDFLPEDGTIEESNKDDLSWSKNGEASLMISYAGRQPTEEALRQRLREELLSLQELSSKPAPVAETILQSDIYNKLQEKIKNSEAIKDNDVFWEELQEIVLVDSPNFISNLRLLTSGKLTMSDIQTALLIKCGIRPVQIKKLINRSNGTIVSRRETLGYKLLDKKLSVSIIDNIIRLL